MSGFTDCLVLKIEEHYIDTKNLDTTLYILYDKKEHQYVVRGQRYSYKIDSCTFSFTCEFAHELVDFISFVVCTKNEWSYVLYNYDNLPATSDEITYDFLMKNESKVYELAGYEEQTYDEEVLLKHLRMLRNVFNHYN
jgi:hypothetical protein